MINKLLSFVVIFSMLIINIVQYIKQSALYRTNKNDYAKRGKLYCLIMILFSIAGIVFVCFDIVIK